MALIVSVPFDNSGVLLERFEVWKLEILNRLFLGERSPWSKGVIGGRMHQGWVGILATNEAVTVCCVMCPIAR